MPDALSCPRSGFEPKKIVDSGKAANQEPVGRGARVDAKDSGRLLDNVAG